MSLRSFHIVFILASLGLLSFMAFWSAARVMEGADSFSRILAGVSILGLLLGIPYLQWFLRHGRTGA